MGEHQFTTVNDDGSLSKIALLSFFRIASNWHIYTPPSLNAGKYFLQTSIMIISKTNCLSLLVKILYIGLFKLKRKTICRNNTIQHISNKCTLIFCLIIWFFIWHIKNFSCTYFNQSLNAHNWILLKKVKLPILSIWLISKIGRKKDFLVFLIA